MQIISTACALLCACVGSVHDLRERRIPNWLTGLGTVAGLSLHTAAGGWHGLEVSVFAGLLAGGISLIFWVAGGLGAGDVKLMTAIGCLAGMSSLRLELISIALFGAGFAIVFSLYRGRLRETLRNVAVLLQHHRREGLRPHPELNLDNAGALRLPFALPIAFGCLFVMCRLAWEAYA